MKRILVAGAIMLAMAGTVQAQSGSGSDHSGPGGAGAGMGGTVGAFLPVPGTGGGAGLSGLGLSGIGGVASSYSAGANVTTTIGGNTVTVPDASVRQVGGVLSGTSGAQAGFAGALTAGGVGSIAANNLATAMATLGASPSFANLVLAVQAYNAAVQALAPGAQPPGALLAARAALARLSATRGYSRFR